MTKRMNILFLNRGPVLPYAGGIQMITYLLANFFREKGHCVKFISYMSKEEACAFYHTKSDAIKLLEEQYFLPATSPDEETTINEKAEVLTAFAKDNRIDLIINQSGEYGQLCKTAYIAKNNLKNLKLISAIHTSVLGKINNASISFAPRLKALGLAWAASLLRLKLSVFLLKKYYIRKVGRHYLNLEKNSDKIVLLSKNLIGEFDEVLGFRSKKLAYVNNAFSPKLKSIPTSEKEKKILWIGRMESGKCPMQFVRIWRKIQDSCPDWSVDMVGTGPQFANVVKLSEQIGAKRINFAGMKESTPFLEKSSIFCFTSAFDGFGIAVIEAQKCACAPILFDSYPAARDIVSDNQNGMLVRPFDLDEYANKLKMLIADEALRNKIANNAVINSERFTVEKIGSDWLEIFSDIDA